MRSLAVLAFIALLGCSKAEQRVDDAVVNLAAVPTNPSVAYFTVHGGEADDTLIDVNSPVVIRTEMHESMTSGNMASMKPIESVAIPAKGKVEFKPGGKHVMLFDINTSVKPGGSLPLIFSFSSGEQIQVDAPVQAAGAVPK